MKKKEIIFVLIIPALLIFLAFLIYPIFETIRYSFFNWPGFGKGMTFIGLDNYKELLNDKWYLLTLKNTLIYAFVGGALIFLLSFLFTFLLGNIAPRARKIFRIIIVLPYMVSPVALANIWNFVYNPNMGFINTFLRMLRLDFLTMEWTAPKMLIWSLTVAIVWFQVGFYTVILTAASEKIPADYFEAADIDGANKLQKFFRINLPLIINELEVCIIFWLLTAIGMFGFIFAFSMASDPPMESWTQAVYMYIMAFGKRTPIYRFGYASTIGVSIGLISLISILSVRFLLRNKERVEF